MPPGAHRCAHPTATMVSHRGGRGTELFSTMHGHLVPDSFDEGSCELITAHSTHSAHLEAFAKGADEDLGAGGAELAARGLGLGAEAGLEDGEDALDADADADCRDVLAAVHADQAVVPAHTPHLNGGRHRCGVQHLSHPGLHAGRGRHRRGAGTPRGTGRCVWRLLLCRENADRPHRPATPAVAPGVTGSRHEQNEHPQMSCMHAC